jgi:hypothetical protein
MKYANNAHAEKGLSNFLLPLLFWWMLLREPTTIGANMGTHERGVGALRPL